MSKIKTIGELRDYLNELIEIHGEDLLVRKRGFLNSDYDDYPSAVGLSDMDFSMMFLCDRSSEFRDDQLMHSAQTEADKKTLVID